MKVRPGVLALFFTGRLAPGHQHVMKAAVMRIGSRRTGRRSALPRRSARGSRWRSSRRSAVARYGGDLGSSHIIVFTGTDAVPRDLSNRLRAWQLGIPSAQKLMMNNP
jgi:hypothetical protein